MELEKIKNKGSARIFTNNFLELLTKTKPWIIYSIYIPISAIMLYQSYFRFGFSIGLITSLFFIALFSWSLFEYLAHRYLFHFSTDNPIGQRIVYIFHGNHHEYPRDKERLFMPPLPSIILGGIVFSCFYIVSMLITGKGTYAFIYFPGFITGYLLYVSMHYAIHAFSPPKSMKALWRNHHLHHYKYPEKGFGVSSTLWDRIFGTMPEKSD